MKETNVIEQLEALIRAGDFKKAEQILKRMSPRKIPREQALPIANFARRVNQCSIALKILNPLVHREPHSRDEPASELEEIEYAENLRKMGVVEEAIEILDGIDGKRFPRSLLHRALCCFSQWKYQEAIPYLRSYIESNGINDYASLVGRVNLVAALIYVSELDEAETLLAVIREETKAAGHGLLYGNALELSAQAAIKQNHFSEASRYLTEAEDWLKNSSDVEKVWIRKWGAILNGLAHHQVSKEIESVRELAVKAGHWETVRDCAYYSAHISRDSREMDYVFFGTPYDSYRSSILRSNQSWYAPSSEILLLPKEKFSGVELHLSSGRLEGDSRDLIGMGQLQHRLLILLARDFFKPLPLLAAFGQLFPGEHFNPISAPSRVYQTVARLRRGLQQIVDGPSVREENGRYKLEMEGSVAIRIARDPMALELTDIKVNLLAKRFGPNPFSASEAQAIIGGSVSSIQRILREALSRKQMIRLSAGPSTKYQLTFSDEV